MRNFLEMIDNFSKINLEKSIASPYTNSKKTEKVITETLPFTISSKRNKISTNISQGCERPL